MGVVGIWEIQGEQDDGRETPIKKESFKMLRKIGSNAYQIN